MAARKIRSRLSKGRKQALQADLLYQIGPVTIRLPPDHPLPTYQRDCQLYDRFLPFLVKNLPYRTTVVDVGANCGDTLAAMIGANSDLSYICIEPDKTFFQYLCSNVHSMKLQFPQTPIKCLPELVGKAVTSASLVSHGGTRTASRHGTDFHSKTLDTILSGARPSLIKSDVEGFDYDVIASAATTIATSSPILFFEYNCIKPEQIKPYADTIMELEARGYKFVALDNFGLPMLQAVDSDVIIQLAGYVQHQNEGRGRRTIYYLDILASTERDRPVIERSLSEYLNNCPAALPA
jgi:FkbM family methyltransferase